MRNPAAQRSLHVGIYVCLPLALMVWMATIAPFADAGPADRSSAKSEVLRGVTQVRGTRPAAMPVRLPQRATVSTTIESSADIKVSGRGRFVGFALVPEDPEVPVLLGGRLPDSAGSHRVLMPVLGQATGTFIPSYPDVMVLPEGDYRLFLLPDSGPATVTLKLHGLPGKTVLRPTEPVHYELLEPEVFSPPGAPYYSAGAESELRSTGLVFQALWIQADAHLDGVLHFCKNGPEHPVASEAPPQVAYGPGCAGAGGGVTEDRRAEVEPHRKLYFQAWAPLEPAVHGQGFYFAAASMIKSVGHLALWLSYE